MSLDYTTVVIGAGHAGLAISRCLAARSVDHVVLERGRVANSWRSERWDSLRLLTPNWQSRLPGFEYEGDDADGFMTMPEVIEFIDKYRSAIGAPVETDTAVTSVASTSEGYSITTDRGVLKSRTIVLASGACNVATVPAVADEMPSSIDSLTPMEYKNPGQLADGGVLVVGASATGIQLADEIHRSGRPVILSVGEHVRLPRVYRGRDIFWWMDAAGVLDETYTEIDDLVRARRLPSPQLVGTAERSSIDLNSLRDVGVELVGRLGGFRGGEAQFSGSLPNLCALADLKMNRLLARFDEWAAESGRDADVESVQRFEPTALNGSPPLAISLGTGRIKTILWATGYRPDYSWLEVPVLDRKGRIRHDGGVVTDAPGMYLIGTNVLRRRRSSFINGAGPDAEYLADHLSGLDPQ